MKHAQSLCREDVDEWRNIIHVGKINFCCWDGEDDEKMFEDQWGGHSSKMKIKTLNFKKIILIVCIPSLRGLWVSASGCGSSGPGLPAASAGRPVPSWTLAPPSAALISPSAGWPPCWWLKPAAAPGPPGSPTSSLPPPEPTKRRGRTGGGCRCWMWWFINTNDE